MKRHSSQHPDRQEDDDAAFVDSFFLPGGILDPEEDQKEKARDDEFVFPTLSLSNPWNAEATTPKQSTSSSPWDLGVARQSSNPSIPGGIGPPGLSSLNDANATTPINSASASNMNDPIDLDWPRKSTRSLMDDRLARGSDPGLIGGISLQSPPNPRFFASTSELPSEMGTRIMSEPLQDTLSPRVIVTPHLLSRKVHSDTNSAATTPGGIGVPGAAPPPPGFEHVTIQPLALPQTQQTPIQLDHTSAADDTATNQEVLVESDMKNNASSYRNITMSSDNANVAAAIRPVKTKENAKNRHEKATNTSANKIRLNRALRGKSATTSTDETEKVGVATQKSSTRPARDNTTTTELVSPKTTSPTYTTRANRKSNVDSKQSEHAVEYTVLQYSDEDSTIEKSDDDDSAASFISELTDHSNALGSKAQQSVGIPSDLSNRGVVDGKSGGGRVNTKDAATTASWGLRSLTLPSLKHKTPLGSTDKSPATKDNAVPALPTKKRTKHQAKSSARTTKYESAPRPEIQLPSLQIFETLLDPTSYTAKVKQKFGPYVADIYKLLTFTTLIVWRVVKVFVTLAFDIVTFAVDNPKTYDKSAIEGAFLCYCTLYSTPYVGDYLLLYANAPYYLPYLISYIILLILAQVDRGTETSHRSQQLRHRKSLISCRVSDRIFSTVYFWVPLEFLIIGLPYRNISLMVMSTADRLVLAFVFACLRDGLILSPTAWCSWAMQTLAVHYLPHNVWLHLALMFFGIASIRLVCWLQTISFHSKND